jgi:hypothetical protein
MMSKHQQYQRQDCGLFIDHTEPYLGASPDALSSCDCCGKGVVEVKCPVCQDLTQIPPCLDSNLMLKKNHAYFYQVQFQMGITKHTYCDFVVWKTEQVIINRIAFEEAFFIEMVSKCREFFKKCILPELLAHYFTNHPVPGDKVAVLDTSDAVCYCRRTSQENLVLCSTATCKIKIFHLGCLRLKNMPKKSWTCPDCKVLAKLASTSAK